MKKLAIFSFLAVFMAGSLCYAGNIVKIGVIDMQRVLNTSKAGKLASKELNTQGEKMQKILQEKGAEFEELKKTLTRKAMVMNAEKLAEIRRELRIKGNDLKTMDATFTEKIKKTEAQLRQKILEEVVAVAEKIGKKEGYTLILDRSEGGVIYMPDSIDITDQVITTFNKAQP